MIPQRLRGYLCHLDGMLWPSPLTLDLQNLIRRTNDRTNAVDWHPENIMSSPTTSGVESIKKTAEITRDGGGRAEEGNWPARLRTFHQLTGWVRVRKAKHILIHRSVRWPNFCRNTGHRPAASRSVVSTQRRQYDTVHINNNSSSAQSTVIQKDLLCITKMSLRD